MTGRTFAEKRGNGTACQRNSSRENSGPVTVDVTANPAFAWSAEKIPERNEGAAERQQHGNEALHREMNTVHGRKTSFRPRPNAY